MTFFSVYFLLLGQPLNDVCARDEDDKRAHPHPCRILSLLLFVIIILCKILNTHSVRGTAPIPQTLEHAYFKQVVIFASPFNAYYMGACACLRVYMIIIFRASSILILLRFTGAVGGGVATVKSGEIVPPVGVRWWSV